MTFKRPYGAGLAALAVGLFAATAAYAEPTVNKGDNAWMLTSTLLVILMIIPGLALFYGGLVRAKNMLSVLMQCTMIACVVMIVWVLWGYSFAFGGGTSPFWGGFGKLFLAGVGPDSEAATFTDGVVIPEYVFICFQMTFAMITPGLIVGAFAERIKFSALLVFIVLWVTFIYFPMAHMVWYWGGPDVVAGAAKTLASATDDAAKTSAQAALDAVNADAGFLFKKGALDFAGGIVVHTTAGISALLLAILVGRRRGFPTTLTPPPPPTAPRRSSTTTTSRPPSGRASPCCARRRPASSPTTPTCSSRRGRTPAACPTSSPARAARRWRRRRRRWPAPPSGTSSTSCATSTSWRT